METQTQDTETLFKKKMSTSVGMLVFVIVTMVLSGIISTYHGSSPLSISTSLALNFSTPITYAVCLIIFSGIGKAKGKENRIMSFIFGIMTLVLSALMIVDRATKISGTITSLISDIEGIPIDPLNIPDTILRSVMLAFIIVVIVFSITSIVNSVALIKANVPSSQAKTTRPSGSATISSPATFSPPAASSGPQAQFCSSCGASLEPGAAFCNKCGAKV